MGPPSAYGGGGAGWICGPANCLVEPCVKFYNAFASGDLKQAQAIAKTLYPVMTKLESGAIKIELADFDVFTSVIRVPRPQQARLAIGVWWARR